MYFSLLLMSISFRVRCKIKVKTEVDINLQKKEYKECLKAEQVIRSDTIDLCLG